ncbi:MAG TPA: plastocyanin/azurin family copper-binding protein [Gemmatimonadaceae bacterium]|jgi:plastocyanin|nr:plastocyanin/azurin family copper-binding protein [Gemmatimonadaceae bacterium]
MRFNGLVLMASAAVLAACSGGETAKTDTTAAAPAAAAAAPQAAATPAAGAVAAMPITGTIHEVKMVGDASGYKFEPAELTIKQGDGIKFIMVAGGPHNVAFDPASIPADVKPQLSANMPNQSAELSGPMLLNPNDSYTVSFAGIKPGKYEFHCTPHLAMNMKGAVTVQ